jgi:DNA polymerase I-like protein with 3'-5' exonuclease and polymerase domains
MMDILTIDMETFYSTQFSLSKITTEQYVRDPQFETIGVAVKKNDEKTVWFSGDDEETQDFLNQFDWGNSLAIAHNAVFDMAILNWRYGIRPKRIADTLSMARALVGTNTSVSLKSLAEYFGIGEKGTEVVNALGKRRADFTPEELRRYGHYCVNDVELTRTLFDALVDMGFPTDEFKLVDLTIRMFTEPVLGLDVGALTSHLANVRVDNETALEETFRVCEQLGYL